MTTRNAIYTDEDAMGGMLCPFSFNAPELRRLDGEVYREAGPHYCRGQACMAWRWYATHVSGEADHGELILRGDAYGYCGLAGSPECAGARP